MKVRGFFASAALTEVRCHVGPLAKEVFILCRPDPSEGNIAGQTASVYHALRTALRSEGGSTEHVAQETVFFRHIRNDFAPFHQTRAQVSGSLTGTAPYAPAASFIQQPPLDERHLVELLAYAVIPKRGAMSIKSGPPLPSQPAQRTFWVGDQKHIFAANIHGVPGTAEEEAYSMFCAAGALLREERMSFHDVVRTWIHLRHMDRDYSGLNRGRTRFFREQALELPPASTGIGGASGAEDRSMCLSLCAIQVPTPVAVQRMSAPTLNEAWTYGSDFSRGLKVRETNAVTLFVSGTASVDEEGRTVHADDFEAQAERMILNISTLLKEQNASFRDVVSATIYVRDAADAPSLIKVLGRNGIDDFPIAMVQARVCRPDLLCEMEAIAKLLDAEHTKYTKGTE